MKPTPDPKPQRAGAFSAADFNSDDFDTGLGRTRPPGGGTLSGAGTPTLGTVEKAGSPAPGTIQGD